MSIFDLRANLDRTYVGKALREKVPRTSHGKYRVDRPDPVAILEKQSETRVQKLVPIRRPSAAAASRSTPTSSAA